MRSRDKNMTRINNELVVSNGSNGTLLKLIVKTWQTTDWIVLLELIIYFFLSTLHEKPSISWYRL